MKANKFWISIFAVFAFIGFSLLPVLKSGYYSDDIIVSLGRIYSDFNHWNFLQYWWNNISNIVLAPGRIHFLNPQFFAAYFLTNLAAYKSSLVLLTAASGALFFAFLLVKSKDNKFGLITTALLPALFQFRLNHDPILSFYWTQQVIVIYIFLGLIFSELYLSNKKPNLMYLVLGCIFFNLIIYTYEIGQLFVLLFVGYIFIRGKSNFKQKIIISLPYIISFIFSIGLLALSKSHQVATYSGNEFNFNLLKIVQTFLIQTSASLPLSYFSGHEHFIFCRTIDCFRSQIRITDMLMFLAFVIIYYVSISRNTSKTDYKSNIFLSLLLVFVPSLVTSISQKYQNELISYGWGNGYVFVFIQYFGVALAISTLLAYLKQKLSQNAWTAISPVVCFLLGIMLVLNLQNNRIVIDKSNIDLKYRQDALANSLENGILKNTKNSDVIFILDQYTFDPYRYFSVLRGWALDYPWRNRYFVYKFSRHKYNIETNIDAYLGSKTRKLVLVIKSEKNRRQSREGYVVLGELISYTKFDGIRKGIYRPIKEYENNKIINLENGPLEEVFFDRNLNSVNYYGK